LANTASDYSLNLMIMGVMLILISAIGFVYWSTFQSSDRMWNFSKYFSVIVVGAYSASMFASSFVEEEHLSWYSFLQMMSLLSILHR
jgi:ethanolaminephosphotransferase